MEAPSYLMYCHQLPVVRIADAAEGRRLPMLLLANVAMFTCGGTFSNEHFRHEDRIGCVRVTR